ncbi:MAG: leucine-rich repeat domain-containing protein [Oscillospiraceae bacterium]|nr:leucine-rich repeat domain-containing protein [Oscillospiraceae bacterium]
MSVLWTALAALAAKTIIEAYNSKSKENTRKPVSSEYKKEPEKIKAPGVNTEKTVTPEYIKEPERIKASDVNTEKTVTSDYKKSEPIRRWWEQTKLDLYGYKVYYSKIETDKLFDASTCQWMNTDFFSDATMKRFGNIMKSEECDIKNLDDMYEFRMRNHCLLKIKSMDNVNTLLNFVRDDPGPNHLVYVYQYFHRSENSEYAEYLDGIIYSETVCLGMEDDSEALTPRTVVIRSGTECIADSALADSYNICKLIFPNSLVSIGTGSVERSPKLRLVWISENLKYIQNAAFRYCWKLEKIYLPYGLLYIGHEAFRSCNSLKYVTIPDSVTYIGARAFYRCLNLNAVKLSRNIKIISSGMFMHCHQLEQIVIPEGVTVIEKDAFAFCSNLKRVFLPEGLEKIEDGAFSDCKQLKYIKVPDSITFLGADLFGTKKKYKTIVSSSENKYVISYALKNQINWTDKFTEKWHREMLKRVSSGNDDKH